MGDNGFINSFQQQFQQPGPLAVKIAQVVRQTSPAAALARTEAAVADVHFEQMIIAIERFAIVGEINRMISMGWENLRTDYIGVGTTALHAANSLWSVYVCNLTQIAAEAGTIRENLLRLRGQTDVDATTQILLSKMRDILQAANQAEAAHAFYLQADRQAKSLAEYMSIAERALVIVRLGQVQRRILDISISHWNLPEVAHGAVRFLMEGERERGMREPLIKKLYLDAGGNFGVVADQYRALAQRVRTSR